MGVHIQYDGETVELTCFGGSESVNATMSVTLLIQKPQQIIVFWLTIFSDGQVYI